MFMQAVVIEVRWDHLFVIDLETRQSVNVNTLVARQFRPGDLVNIWYNGVMTNSIPPQIYALRITRAQAGPVPPVLPPPVVRPPCPPNVCLPNVRPPILWPPVILPPVVRPPVGRPPHNRPGRPR